MNKKLVQECVKLSLREAYKGMRDGDGGPFGAVIVRKGKVISVGHNEVLKRNDPTCHAEVVAIRKACAKLKNFDLSDCEIFTSCEPCPMCFATIHWAKMRKMYYGCTRDDAAHIGFDDKFIYDVLKGKAKKKQVTAVQVAHAECLGPFKEWEGKAGKKRY